MAFFSPLMADTKAKIQNTNKANMQAIIAKFINQPKTGIKTNIPLLMAKIIPVNNIPSACLR